MDAFIIVICLEKKRKVVVLDQTAQKISCWCRCHPTVYLLSGYLRTVGNRNFFWSYISLQLSRYHKFYGSSMFISIFFSLLLKIHQRSNSHRADHSIIHIFLFPQKSFRFQWFVSVLDSHTFCNRWWYFFSIYWVKNSKMNSNCSYNFQIYTLN